MSALREAIEAVLEENSTSGVRATNVYALLRDRLVEAVERVPVKVTIRDLDMDSENIVTVADSTEVTYLAGHVRAANQGRLPLHLTIDRGAIKCKVGNGSWSAPIETEPYEG